MKVVHIESGLGNQMLSYCEYLALKNVNKNDNIFIETIIYDIPECNQVICQWNGYELERIFGIDAPNIKSQLTNVQWKEVMDFLYESKFWEKNWNYPVWITKALNNVGLNLENIRGNFEEKNFAKKYSNKRTIKSIFVDSYIGNNVKRLKNKIFEKRIIKKLDNTKNIFLKTDKNIFTGQWLSFKLRSNNIEKIDNLIRKTFIFPNFTDKKNMETSKLLENCNSIAIHVRRSDMLNMNKECYKYGYFKRAVKIIRRHVNNPVFVFFCDTDSVQWCKKNEKIFGLNYKKDNVIFVDWNKGKDSFRDMQLMSYCKHAIITNSSFGWWGAYFIKNPNKITISPNITINTTHHC